MASFKETPRALLFDIGGVLVRSPIAAILAWEQRHKLPAGWINFAISSSGPTGAWARLERGEVLMNHRFFAAFRADLEDATLWRRYHEAQFERQRVPADQRQVPPPPTVDAEAMFWNMMGYAREPDPHMAPALQRLRASGQFLLGALSNTSIFPPGHPYNDPSNDRSALHKQFDVFVSSAHVGMRKPERRIYELAVRWMRDAMMGRGGAELQPGDIVFLDDIGANLKAAREVGLRTVKVGLGDTRGAVRELEGLTGMRLLEEGASSVKL